MVGSFVSSEGVVSNMLRGQGFTMIQTMGERTGIGRVEVPSPEEVVGARHFARGGSRVTKPVMCRCNNAVRTRRSRTTSYCRVAYT